MSNFDYKMDISITLKTENKLADTQYNRDNLLFELNYIEDDLLDKVRDEIYELKMQVRQGGRLCE